MIRGTGGAPWLSGLWKLLALILLIGPLLFAAMVLLPYGPVAGWDFGAAERWQVALLALVWAILLGSLLWVVGKALNSAGWKKDRRSR